jgi:hypothetical protein
MPIISRQQLTKLDVALSLAALLFNLAVTQSASGRRTRCARDPSLAIPKVPQRGRGRGSLANLFADPWP